MTRTTYCDRCDICIHNEFTPHWGGGNINADIMFISDFPSKREKRKQNVFDGNKYTIINKLMMLHNFNMNNSYVTYLVKCNVPNNRPPSYIEARNCTYLLVEELTVVKPTIIVLIGSYALKHFYNDPNISLYKEHGKAKLVGNKIIIPTFNASFLNLNKDKIIDAVKDWQLISYIYGRLHPEHYNLY